MLKRRLVCTAAITALALIASPARLAAAETPARPGFHSGSIITDFGPIASVEGAEPLPADIAFNIAFDVAVAAAPGTINRTVEAAARFINMHAEAGVPPERIRIAIVVHGPASFDFTNAATYANKHDGAVNANLAAVAKLQQHGVDVYICGQSAAALGITFTDLAPGVKLALSAMTAHALLQQQGYTLNPF